MASFCFSAVNVALPHNPYILPLASFCFSAAKDWLPAKSNHLTNGFVLSNRRAEMDRVNEEVKNGTSYQWVRFCQISEKAKTSVQPLHLIIGFVSSFTRDECSWQTKVEESVQVSQQFGWQGQRKTDDRERQLNASLHSRACQTLARRL